MQTYGAELYESPTAADDNKLSDGMARSLSLSLRHITASPLQVQFHTGR